MEFEGNMRTLLAFMDTSIVNRVLNIDEVRSYDAKWEEDRTYLTQIIKDYVNKNLVRLIVNPTVERQINKTRCAQRREQLLKKFKQFGFTSDNKTIFPFTFPATFVTEKEREKLEELCGEIKGFERDQKIFIDTVSNPEVDVLLTTDRKHLVGKELSSQSVLVLTPKEFHEYLQEMSMMEN